MSVLEDDLPPKTEFVITVPLTEIQEKAYSIYVQAMLRTQYTVTKSGQISHATVWSWLALLSLLCNHPQCFMAKLEQSRSKTADGSSPADSSGLEDEPVKTDVDLNARVDVSESLIDEETKLFAGVDLNAIDLSYKVKILCQILDHAKEAGDKTLIFSQSIPTLDYLERLCQEQSRNYKRLDGQTAMKSRQKAVMEFNTNSSEIYLISTTAGGLGLNISGANRIVIFDFKYNPANEEQAVGRAYRIGQKKATFVYRFVAGGTFEEEIQNKAVSYILDLLCNIRLRFPPTSALGFKYL